jgi:hypothetical protein
MHFKRGLLPSNHHRGLMLRRTALFNNNKNTILSTVSHCSTAHLRNPVNPDSPQQAPLNHPQPNIPTDIFNNANNNTNIPLIYEIQPILTMTVATISTTKALYLPLSNTVPLTFETSLILPTSAQASPTSYPMN